jgi:AraC-like DNA-binding protein
MAFYQEYLPDSSLQHLIKCYWIFENTGDDLSEDIITHNGSLNMVFTIRGSITEYGLESLRLIPQNFVFPLSSAPVRISYRKLKCVGIGLQPWANHAFFKTSMDKMGAREHDIKKDIENDLAVIVNNIGKAQDSNDEIIRLIEEFCFSRIKRPKSTDEPFKEIIGRIFEANGELSIDAICDALHLTKRGVELKFQKNVGSSPKYFLQKVRFHSFLKQALAQKDTDLTQLALNTGYYDQSHLIRTSKKFTGLPPSRLVPILNTSNGLSKKINFSL